MRTEALDLAASESLWMYLWPIGLDGCSPGIHLNQNSPPGAMPCQRQPKTDQLSAAVSAGHRKIGAPS
jgi:hypothetical protein